MDREFIDRMQALVNDHAGGVYTRFARQISVSATTMQRYLEGRAVPGYNILRGICDACGVTPNWLLLGWEPRYRNGGTVGAETIHIVSPGDTEAVSAADFQVVPIVNHHAWDEGADTAINPQTVTGCVILRFAVDRRLFGVRAEDDSMRPEIEPEDLLVIDPGMRDPAALENRLTLAHTENGVTVRRLVNGILYSNNPRFFPPERASKTKLLGAVSQVRRDS
ncbi:MAG: LexA family transcriptional regulator [Candidatus Lernaella stagnicola]|nr:LexA family transcriptional regulator [Candidatus Lernaella stagnicola]